MAADSIRIRRARAERRDLDQLAVLFDAYRQFYGRPSARAVARRYLKQRLSRGESVVFLAEHQSDRSAVGFVQLYPAFSSISARRSWILNDLYVDPSARRTGTARRLIERAREHAIQTRAAYIELATSRANAAAQALYESQGYKPDNEFIHYSLTLPPR